MVEARREREGIRFGLEKITEAEREREESVLCVDSEGLRSEREVVGTWDPVTSSELDPTVLIRPNF